MNQPDTIMAQVGHGIELGGRGDREAARELFARLWEQVSEVGDPLHRCAIAHSMADVQDDPRDELAWDLRALEAADSVTPERAAAAGVVTPVASFYPSLHLNLGEAYRKLGDLGSARTHLRLGQDAAQAFGDDGYARMIRGGLDGLATRLGETG